MNLNAISETYRTHRCLSLVALLGESRVSNSHFMSSIEAGKSDKYGKISRADLSTNCLSWFRSPAIFNFAALHLIGFGFRRVKKTCTPTSKPSKFFLQLTLGPDCTEFFWLLRYSSKFPPFTEPQACTIRGCVLNPKCHPHWHTEGGHKMTQCLCCYLQQNILVRQFESLFAFLESHTLVYLIEESYCSKIWYLSRKSAFCPLSNQFSPALAQLNSDNVSNDIWSILSSAQFFCPVPIQNPYSGVESERKQSAWYLLGIINNRNETHRKKTLAQLFINQLLDWGANKQDRWLHASYSEPEPAVRRPLLLC